jgi:formylglycine-generating enzyme required for sulfatase activity
VTSLPPLAGPYPGLRPFQKHEWPIFFGREPMIDEVLQRLAATRLVVVHGSSGCGKSSLIKAGVLPRLEQEHSHYGVPWRTAEMRPGSSPLWNLAMAIARLHEQLEGAAEPTLDTTRTVRRLLDGGRDALAGIRQRFGLGKDGNVCLLLDQFEELFRYARDIGPEEAAALIEVLRGFELAPEDGGRGPAAGIYAILTLRSDHLGDCGHFEGFAELLNATQYLLPRMHDAALLRAIREPARLFGGEVAPDLAVCLVDESRAEIDALPLVQHALMRLWRQAGGAAGNPSPQRPDTASGPEPVLTAEGYSGLEALLNEHAEEVLRDVTAKDPASAKVTEYVFRALTEVDAEGRGIRRPRRLSELVRATGGIRSILEQVVERFAQPDCGFLVRSSGDDPMIDLGHEALIRCWRQLSDPTMEEITRPPRGWLQRAAAAARIWRHTGTARRPRGWLQREREDARIWRSMLVQGEAGDRISRAVLEDREAWFAALPGPAWAERYDGGWDRIGQLLTSSRNAARLGRFGRVGAVVSALLLAAVSSWWTVGVTPRDGLMMLGLRVGLVTPELDMIELPAGVFKMGSTEPERQWAIDQGTRPEWVASEAPQHEVEIRHPFAISKYEVTFDDWDLCVADGGCNGYRPSDLGWGRGRRPVINVSWDDAKVYVDWLSKVTDEPYRLLTEAEWEYAARAETTAPFSLPAPDGSDDITGKGLANCNGCGSEWGGRRTALVGSFPANRFGLHDTAGNVWEWVEDCGHDSYAEEGRPDDGSAWVSGDCGQRVLRGSSWDLTPQSLRSAFRLPTLTDFRLNQFGFRVARTLSR